MNAIDKLRQARNPDDLAREIEPLAQSLATLADETRQSLTEQQQASREQAAHWSQQQQAAQAWQDAAASLDNAAQQLKVQIEAATQAQQHWVWTVLLVGLLSGTLAAVVTSACWRWLAPPVITNNVTLDAQSLADYLKPVLDNARKHR